MIKTMQNQKGLTVIEVLIGVAIIVILASITALSFSNFSKGQFLPNTVDEVSAILNEARARTLAGESDSRYGVHLQGDKAVLFSGTSYVAGAAGNKVILIDPSVVLSSISLAGGGSDVIFNQITGETSQYGTLIVKLATTTTGQKTITVTKTGLISTN